MRRGWLGLFLVLSLTIVGCASAAPLDQPPDIRYGEDICDQCGMIISEARFAAAYVTSQGEVRRFDDIGGMLRFHLERSEDVAVFWVHDYETEAWVRADQATFVMDEELYTPMGFGIVAFSEPQRAQRLAAERQGRLFTFEELMAYFSSGEALEPHPKAMDDSMGSHEMDTP